MYTDTCIQYLQERREQRCDCLEPWLQSSPCQVTEEWPLLSSAVWLCYSSLSHSLAIAVWEQDGVSCYGDSWALVSLSPRVLGAEDLDGMVQLLATQDGSTNCSLAFSRCKFPMRRCCRNQTFVLSMDADPLLTPMEHGACGLSAQEMTMRLASSPCCGVLFWVCYSFFS